MVSSMCFVNKLSGYAANLSIGRKLSALTPFFDLTAISENSIFRSVVRELSFCPPNAKVNLLKHRLKATFFYILPYALENILVWITQCKHK